jgi:predicted double-glycine peptidase
MSGTFAGYFTDESLKPRRRKKKEFLLQFRYNDGRVAMTIAPEVYKPIREEGLLWCFFFELGGSDRPVGSSSESGGPR